MSKQNQPSWASKLTTQQHRRNPSRGDPMVSHNDAERHPSIKWSEIVKSGPQTLPEELMKRIEEWRANVKTSVSEQRQPVIRAVYFSGIPRCPICALKKSFRKCLSAWAVLSICFIGKVTEILWHLPIVDRLIPTLTILGYKVITSFDPTRYKGANENAMRACIARCKKLGHDLPSPAVSLW